MAQQDNREEQEEESLLFYPLHTERWKKRGHVIKKGGEMIGETTRLLRVDIKIKATNLKISKQKKS